MRSSAAFQKTESDFNKSNYGNFAQPKTSKFSQRAGSSMFKSCTRDELKKVKDHRMKEQLRINGTILQLRMKRENM